MNKIDESDVWFKNRIMESLKKDEMVDVVATNQDPIPAGANPFNYDLFHMGTDISRGWMIMHQGGSVNDKPLDYLILINTNTGQRVRLDFFSTEMKIKDVLYYSVERDQRIGVGPLYTPTQSKERPDGINWITIEQFDENAFLCFGKFFAKFSLVINKEEFHKAVEKEFSDDIEVSDKVVEEKLKAVSDWRRQLAIEEIRQLEEDRANGKLTY